MNDLTENETSPYAFSEKMYMAECAFSYFISIITTGAYLAKLTTTIGISDSMTAILSNIASLACIFQLLSIPLSHKPSLKRSVIPTRLISHLLLGFLYLTPFFGFTTQLNSVFFFICTFLSYVLAQICAPLKFTWFMSLPSPERKGSFQSMVQIVSHAGGLAFSFAASWLLDYFTKTGNTEAMFITFTAVIFILTLLDLITLLLSKEKPRTQLSNSTILTDIKVIFKQKGFVLYTLMNLFYTVGINLTAPFIGTYQVKELGLSMMEIYLLSASTAVTAIFFLAFFGNYARRNGLVPSMRIGYPIYSVAYLLITLATPENGFWMILAYNIVSTFGNAGMVVGMDPILFDVIPEEYRASALSLKSIVCGVVSFFGTLAMTPLLNYIQASGNKFLGIDMYAQQLFGALTCVMLFISMFLFNAFTKKGINNK